MWTHALIVVVGSTTASAGLRIGVDAPPVAVGGNRWSIDGHEFDVLPRVVVHIPHGLSPRRDMLPLGGRSYTVEVRSAAAAIDEAVELSRLGYAAFPDVRMEVVPLSSSFDDPHRGGQWYLDHLSMADLYDYTLGDPSSRVAVIDSGIDISHPDLADAVDDPYDAFDDDVDPSPNPGEYCSGATAEICDDHGTAVSGVIAARANNGEGIVGMCPECTLVPIKMLGQPQTGSLSENIRAFEHAITADAGVINNSWGFTSATAVPEPLEMVIIRAQTEPRDGLGALVVFAAGNDNREIEGDELQAMDGVLCVSATDAYGRYTNYTNSGAAVDVSAPSATVSLAADGGMTETFGGTSAAAPVVSGLAAWALSIRPDLSAAELREMIVETAVPSPLVTHDQNGHHPIYGYGEVSPRALLATLADPDAMPASEGHAGRSCSVTPAARLSLVPILLSLAVLYRRRHAPLEATRS